VVLEEEALWLSEALERLSPNQRLVLELRFFDRLSAAQVAERVGKSAEAVRQDQHRALLRLQELRREMRPDWSSKP
jgi:RNA polymerase sigma factor (sigma-70 family)